MASFTRPSGNNSKESDSVNTRGIQLINMEGAVRSALQFGFWNGFVNLRFYPPLPADKAGGKTGHEAVDYEQNLSTALTVEKANVILSFIKDGVIPAMKNDTTFSKAVQVSDSLVGVAYGPLGGQKVPFIFLHKNIDERTKLPKESMVYVFKELPVIEDYSPENGSFKLSGDPFSELNVAATILEAATWALTNAQSHNSRHVDKYFRDRLLSGLGVGSTKGGNGGGFKGASNLFSKGNSGPSETAEDIAAREKLENMADMESFMKMD